MFPNRYSFYPHYYGNYMPHYPQNSYNTVNKTPTYVSKHNSRKKLPPKHHCEENSIPNNDEKIKDNVMFELLGIKLYQDDIILICLIFFLYNEGIKDEFLFIALILLLLS